jgi:hypothetical protein
MEQRAQRTSWSVFLEKAGVGAVAAQMGQALDNCSSISAYFNHGRCGWTWNLEENDSMSR